jgi:hypothetical protein
MNSHAAVVLVVFVCTFILLCAINPPMAQEPATHAGTPPTRSIKKIMMWSVLASLTALLLPLGVGGGVVVR